MIYRCQKSPQSLMTFGLGLQKVLKNLCKHKVFSHSNSDDNLLKNIELFDKLGLRFNGRVLFIKDVLGDEICCWSFYGEGRKIAEVCCTSIVYATEKKQTKVSSGELKRLFFCVCIAICLQILASGEIQITLHGEKSLIYIFGYVYPC